LRIVEVPVRLRLDASPKPRDVLKMLVDLIVITYKVRVLRTYGEPVPLFHVVDHVQKQSRGL
jgi:hypothetical protein